MSEPNLTCDTYAVLDALSGIREAICELRPTWPFTREDVAALRVEVRDLRVHANTCRDNRDVEAMLEFERSHRILAAIADRIEARLPPEKSS